MSPRQRQQPAAKPAGTNIAIIEAELGRGIATKFNAGRVVDLEWTAEKRYALAILSDPNNSYLLDCAVANPQSVADALLDLSRLGLSLSPTTKQAYLIPYATKGVKKVTACPSYIGMEQAVLRSEKILAIQTELVYANDTFERWVSSSGPDFKHVPARKDRGAVEGVYCLAQYANGKAHLEYMDADEIEACRQAAIRKNTKQGETAKEPPSWKFFPGEMMKKCCVRRAAKHWPTDKHIERVMEQFDRVNPMDFGGGTSSTENVEAVVCLSDDDITEVLASMDRVPEAQRSVWAMNCAKAMGYGALDEVPVDKKDELIARLVARQEKLVAKKAEKA